MIQVVLDNNILVSALFWDGIPLQIYQQGILGRFRVLVSQEILDELDAVLRYPKFDASWAKIGNYFGKVRLGR